MPMAHVKIKEDDSGNVEPSTVTGISAFLGKLWKMVEDPKTDHLIVWGKSGNSFVIKNQIDFARTILPNYYKHNNIASFIRQLNMYGFHKIISTTSGALDSADNDEIEFTHPNFVRGRSYLLEQIKRKMNNPKENITKSENNMQFNESIKKVLVDIRHLKGKQENLSSQLCAVKQENEILWRELSLLRQKHAAQQNILNKLIRFLVSLAQPANHSLVKRRLVPLMLKDSTSSSTKGRQAPIIHDVRKNDHVYTMKKRDSRSSGPTIHEIHTSDMLDNVIIDGQDGPVLVENEMVHSPASSTSPSETCILSSDPIPAALLRTDEGGKKRIQTIYLRPDQQVSPHFMLSQQDNRTQRVQEYLIPDQTDNPFLELVHETEVDDDNDFITVVVEDESETLPGIFPAAIISDAKASSGSGSGRKRHMGSRKKSSTRKANVNDPTVIRAVQIPKVKQNSKKKAPVVGNVEDKNENTTDTMRPDDFLFDINLQTEPLIDINTPQAANSSTTVEKVPAEYVNVAEASPNSQLKVEIPMDVTNVMSSISPNVDNANTLNVPVSPNFLTSPINPVSPISPISTSPNLLSPNPNNVAVNRVARSDVTLSVGSPIGDKTLSPQKGSADVFMDQMNECIDNAQNMKIACTSDNPPQSKVTDNISTQLDTMQADINSLKELMQNEGLTLDVNTLLGLFNEDPMDYNMPGGNTNDTYRSNGDKIMGNELISASPSPAFDINDIFSNEWSMTPNTPISPYDSDYYTLNTPQIERNTDDSQTLFAPPNKKIKSTDDK